MLKNYAHDYSRFLTILLVPSGSFRSFWVVSCTFWVLLTITHKNSRFLTMLKFRNKQQFLEFIAAPFCALGMKSTHEFGISDGPIFTAHPENGESKLLQVPALSGKQLLVVDWHGSNHCMEVPKL